MDSEITIDLTGPAAVVRWKSEELPLHEDLPSPLQRLLVRTFDLVSSAILLVVLSPAFIFIAVAVRLSGPGPVFYGSDRISRTNGTFAALKFRTMIPNADLVLQHVLLANEELATEYRLNHKLRDDPRVTRIGKFLRTTSLDELPQLVNVLRGEMSLVGPRPKLPSESVLYGETLRTVLRVKPGMTGLWQTKGRNDLSFDERIVLDVTYATTRSFRLDASIILRTLEQLVSADPHGAY